jgi:hypothetical protein
LFLIFQSLFFFSLIHWYVCLFSAYFFSNQRDNYCASVREDTEQVSIAVTIKNHIRKELGTNFGLDSPFTDRDFFPGFPSVPPRKFRIVSQLGNFLYPFELITRLLSYHPSLYCLYTENVVKQLSKTNTAFVSSLSRYMTHIG